MHAPIHYLSSQVQGQVDALCEGSRAECHESMHSYIVTHFEVDALCEGSRAECHGSMTHTCSNPWLL